MFEQLPQQGQTILIITHDPLIAQRAERRITLSDGKIVSNEVTHLSSEIMV
jgi:macrolide transport system ATP-binding/permease protein